MVPLTNSGEGLALVVKTGKNTYIGKINKLAKSIQAKTSTLTIEIRRFTKSLSILAFITAFLFFFIALARGRYF
jgi:magnesium-transporting ATPase (P-type)